ncbi:MAG: radical SAM protein, partial [Bdellovibrionales bacterium]|nr:radical SAM protein [Bdellovibrionales bacterium]
MSTTTFPRLEETLLRWIDSDRWLPLQIDITNACNLRCTHCYHPHHRNTDALGTADWSAIIDQHIALCRKLRFRPSLIVCGGEPLLSPSLFPILAHARKVSQGIPVSILTNGTLLDSALAQRLQAIGDVRLQLSLDGPDAKSHDELRGPGQFGKLQNATALCRAYGLNHHLLAVLTQENAHRISEFFELARNWAVPFMGFTRFVSVGYGRAARANG